MRKLSVLWVALIVFAWLALASIATAQGCVGGQCHRAVGQVHAATVQVNRTVVRTRVSAAERRPVFQRPLLRRSCR